jgi:type I restriction-modification system DNA methylase subunit
MTNLDNFEHFSELVSAWKVETTDITGRVAASVGVSAPPQSEASELLAELRSLRAEMNEFRRANAELRDELTRLRIDIASPTGVRISPFAPTDDVVRLW